MRIIREKKTQSTNQILFDQNKYMLNYDADERIEMVKLYIQRLVYLIHQKRRLDQIEIHSNNRNYSLFCVNKIKYLFK